MMRFPLAICEKWKLVRAIITIITFVAIVAFICMDMEPVTNGLVVAVNLPFIMARTKKSVAVLHTRALLIFMEQVCGISMTVLMVESLRILILEAHIILLR